MIEAVIFDWDGPLSNSFSAHYDFVEREAEKYTIHVPSIQQAKEMIAFPISQWFRKLGFPEEYLAQLVEEYKKYMVRATIPFCDGTIELLHEFKQKYKFGIASSNNRATIEAQLKKAKLDGIFGAVVGLEDVPQPKPSPDCLEKNLQILNAQREYAAYIGDQVTDIITASNAGVMVIAVTYGWHSRKMLAAARPDMIVNSVKELREKLLYLGN